MKKLSFIIALFVASFAIAQSPAPKAKLIEKVTKKPGEIIIPYEKWELPNGLTLIIHEDHSDPIVHVDVTYHVGSNREQIGRSGFAHFFEHMMFQGSDNVADEEHFKIVTESGGTLNGTTNNDRTNYFETLPSNQLEIALWLEADRMGFLLDAVTQQKFEVQRSTVKNERGQRVDNAPYGLVFERISEALYPTGHPYSWPTIGYIEDLNRVDVNDLKKFFLRWYGPNNAALTVAGDVNPQEVIKLVEKYYGSIPRGPEVKPLPKSPGVVDKDRYISYEDNIRFPLLTYTFPTVPAYHKDEAALDVLADVLAGSKNSIFYQKFQKPLKAVNAGCFHWSQELAGLMMFRVMPYPKFNLAQMDSLFRETLVEFEKTGVTQDDIDKYKINYEKDILNSLQSVRGKASMLAEYWFMTRNPNSLPGQMQRVKAVTKEDVMRVYNTYIKNKPSVVLSVYPKGKSNLKAKEDNFQSPVVRDLSNVTEGDEYKKLTYTKPKDNFDRSKKPSTGANPIVKVPDFWKENFANGLKLIGVKSDESPTVTLQLYIESGHRWEEKSKSGLANITADLINESTLKRSAEEMSKELEKIGSSISVFSSTNEIVISVSCLKRNMDATLKLMEEIMFQPKFDETEFERVKKETLENIANQFTQPTTIANNVYYKLLYGNNHILSVPSIGTEETVNSISLDDVKNYYKNNFSPNISQFVIVGDVTKEDILGKVGFLKTWENKNIKRNMQAPVSTIDKTKIYLVDKPKAAQSEVRIGNLSIPYDATGEYYKAYIMNFALGGAFNCRINLNLREDKGWTYGARSGFSGNSIDGSFTASGGIKSDATDSSIVEFIKEMKQYVESGIKVDELSFTKSSIGQSDALKYETPGQKAGFLKRIIEYNLDKSYVDKQNEILKNITKEEVDALAKKLINTNKMIITIVGDKEKIMEPLSKLGYEIILLDNDGNIVK